MASSPRVVVDTSERVADESALAGETFGGSHLDEFCGKCLEPAEHFSQRRAEVLEHLREHGAHSARAAQVAVLETRRTKQFEVLVEQLRDEWRARAAEHGLDRQQVDALLDRGLEELPARRVAPDELTEQASTFSRRDVLQAVAAAQFDGADVTLVERLADDLLDRADIVALEPSSNGPFNPRFTTTGMLAVERGLPADAERREGEGAGLADREVVDAVLGERAELSDEQTDAVRTLTGSGDGVQVLRAAAGTGKTYSLDAAQQAWTRSEIKTVGCALSARAARELEDEAGIDATTIGRLLGDLDRGCALDPGSVLVVDEAGMVGSRTLARLAEHSAHAGAKGCSWATTDSCPRSTQAEPSARSPPARTPPSFGRFAGSVTTGTEPSSASALQPLSRSQFQC